MNRLTVSLQQSIPTLHERGWSARRIARELGLDRATVRRELERSKAAMVATGFEPGTHPNAAKVATGVEFVGQANAARVATGSGSLCAPYRDSIEAGLARGLTAQRIHQDLVEGGFTGRYNTVKRFVRALASTEPLPFRRLESAPGDELQVDFGQGAPVLEGERRRRPHVFRVILSFSRKGYSEVVWRQDTESFLRCLENAFRYFGGVPKTVVPDNLKAAVLTPDWFDPELNPKLAEFARHHGTAILPTKPAMPRHKGKIEAGIKYVQDNALKGRTFGSLGEQNQHLADWEARIADKRIHGTVRQQVETRFLQLEKPALLPLPASIFPSFHEAKRRVHRDGYVEYKKAYYSVPPEHLGREVWVRGDSRLLHVYTLQLRQIAVHALAEPGRFTTVDRHLHPHKRNAIEQGASLLLERCQRIGPQCGAWAKAMYAQRGPIGLRTLQGLLALARKHPVGQLERAGETAVRHGSWRLQDLRRLLAQGDTVVQLDFLQSHELIRDLSVYRVDGFST